MRPGVRQGQAGSVKSPGRGKGGHRSTTSGLRATGRRVADGGDVCGWETELRQVRAAGSRLYCITDLIYFINASLARAHLLIRIFVQQLRRRILSWLAGRGDNLYCEQLCLFKFVRVLQQTNVAAKVVNI